MQSLALDTLRQLASQVGLTVVAVTGTEDLTSDAERLRRWQEAGYAAEMGYMKRDAGLLSSPRVFAEWAKSVVMVAVAYERTPREPLKSGFGRVARYAWGRDYHRVLRRRLELLVEHVRKELGAEVMSRVFSDSVPLLERALAQRAGIGFIGKNTMLIVPREGSFLFLGEVVWDIVVTGMEEQKRPKALSCGSCSQCICECPTGALVGERVLNASRCISYLTIEKRGALTSEERGWLGDWLFGCDICQDVCPFNVVPLKKRLPADIEDLGRAHGVGESLSLVEVLSLRDSRAFEKRFAGTALMRAKREGLLRNAAVVAANTRAVSVASCLVEVSRSDTSPIVRQHALWAAVQLASFEGQEALARRLASDARRDPSPQVIGEANDLLSRLPNGG